MEESIIFETRTKIKKFVTIAFKVFFGIIAAIVFALLFGYGIMWLWNWLMPELFGLVKIGYWQAVGILVLGRLLFGGLGSGHSRRSNKSRSQNRCRPSGPFGLKSDFPNWKHYEKFWEEEGESAYKEYVRRQEKEVQ